AVPDLDGSGTVVSLRDLAFEGRVVERMVLDVDGEMLFAGLERNTFGDGPGRERAVSLETEVVVEPPRVVSLDDEDRFLRLPPLRRERLRRLLPIALALVLCELRHLRSFALRGRSALALPLRSLGFGGGRTRQENEFGGVIVSF